MLVVVKVGELPEHVDFLVLGFGLGDERVRRQIRLHIGRPEDDAALIVRAVRTRSVALEAGRRAGHVARHAGVAELKVAVLRVHRGEESVGP